MQIIRTLIVDDHARFRRSIRAFLAPEPDIEVVGEAVNGQEAILSIGKLGPDLVLMDIRMPGMSGLDAIRQLREMRPTLKILVLTAFETPEHREAAMACGADAFLAKDDTAEMLCPTIRRIMQAPCPS